MTFQEVLDLVFLKLDTSTDIDGDLYTDVYATLKVKYDEIVTEIRPDELLTSGTYTLTAGDDTASIVTDFAISDFEKEHALFVDGQRDPWINRDYRTWLRKDDRRYNIWTRHGDDIILAQEVPTGDSWALVLHYYKTPPTIVLSNSPQFARAHHRTLAWGVLTMYPHLFSGDKEILLLKYEKDYLNGKAAAKRDRAASQKLRSLNPKVFQASTGDVTFAT